jgi:hypothetical protein
VCQISQATIMHGGNSRIVQRGAYRGTIIRQFPDECRLASYLDEISLAWKFIYL